jgi:pyruvate/2-oxoglutarate dehydrogenase complex dihydrolipoamide acyltransferase (E2) component
MREVLLPPLAEGVTKATVSYVYVKKGDKVREGDNLLELVTDKATFNLPAPQAGTVTSIVCQEGDQAEVGKVLLHLE